MGKAIKIVEVEFVRFDGTNFDEVKKFCEGYAHGGKLYGRIQLEYGNICCFLDEGEYVVKSKDGSFQLLTEKDFNSEYQIV